MKQSELLITLKMSILHHEQLEEWGNQTERVCEWWPVIRIEVEVLACNMAAVTCFLWEPLNNPGRYLQGKRQLGTPARPREPESFLNNESQVRPISCLYSPLVPTPPLMLEQGLESENALSKVGNEGWRQWRPHPHPWLPVCSSQHGETIKFNFQSSL